MHFKPEKYVTKYLETVVAYLYFELKDETIYKDEAKNQFRTSQISLSILSFDKSWTIFFPNYQNYCAWYENYSSRIIFECKYILQNAGNRISAHLELKFFPGGHAPGPP